jgi:hypothetical protein
MRQYSRTEMDRVIVSRLKNETGFSGILNVSDQLIQLGMDVAKIGFFMLNLAIFFQVSLPPGTADRFPRSVGQILDLFWGSLPPDRRK